VATLCLRTSDDGIATKCQKAARSFSRCSGASSEDRNRFLRLTQVFLLNSFTKKARRVVAGSKINRAKTEDGR
jgi:hypothetical protein